MSLCVYFFIVCYTSALEFTGIGFVSVGVCVADMMERYYIITISPPLAILGDFL